MVVDQCKISLWRFLFFSFVMSLFAQTTVADTVWLVDQNAPIYGVVESTANGKLRFLKTLDGSKFESIEIDQKLVRQLVTNFDPDRLESLTPGNWETWHEYAEELFVQRKDPVAHRLAMRLLVIVLGNSKDAKLRASAMNDLIGLARNDEERRRLQQLRYLETGEQVAETKPQNRRKLPASKERRSAAKQIKAVRTGQNSIDPSDENLRRIVSHFEQTCSWQELVQISRANRIDNQSLGLLVALELELLSGNKSDATADQKVQWHTLAGRVGSSTLRLPTVSTVTEFDPLATKFENGKWIRR